MVKDPKTEMKYEVVQGEELSQQEFEQLCQMLVDIIYRQTQEQKDPVKPEQ
jgi:hypothetical protein